MFSKKQLRKSIQVTISTTIIHSLEKWLQMDLDEVAAMFGVKPPPYNYLASLGMRKLQDLLLFSKKSLLKGTGISTEEFEAFTEEEKHQVKLMQEKTSYTLVNPEKPWHREKIGAVGMKQVEYMLTQLGLELR